MLTLAYNGDRAFIFCDYTVSWTLGINNKQDRYKT